MKPVDPWEIQSRTVRGFDLRTSTHRHRYKLMNRLIVDDLVENMAKAVAHEINTGEEIYREVPKNIKDYLIRTNLVLRGA